MKDKNKLKVFATILFVVLIICSALMTISFVEVEGVKASPSIWVYTNNADWEKGVEKGVNHVEVPDQLQLNENITMDVFIWIANSEEHTVSKLDTQTGDEVGKYRVDFLFDEAGNIIQGATGDPSRTAVDLDGNVWVACRAEYHGDSRMGAAIKIAAMIEDGVDRNGNGKIDTSKDLNGNGKIDTDEILPPGEDELVLVTVALGENTSPRAVVIDRNNNAWVGLTSPGEYVKLDGRTGEELLRVDAVGPVYGAAIDKDGYLWSCNKFSGTISKINTATAEMVEGYPKFIDNDIYGIAVDNFGHVWIGDGMASNLILIDAATGEVIKRTNVSDSIMRGVVVDNKSNVWVADSNMDRVLKFDNNGNFLREVYVGRGRNNGWEGPVGVAVDVDGNVWVVNKRSSEAIKIDVETNTVKGAYTVGRQPYTYSDMTGYALRHFIVHTGTWTATEDSGIENAEWSKVSWNSYEPEGTSVSVRFRADNTKKKLSAVDWIEVGNGVPFSMAGRYFQVETRLSTTPGSKISPVLRDLTVQSASNKEPCEFNLTGRGKGDITRDKYGHNVTVIKEVCSNEYKNCPRITLKVITPPRIPHYNIVLALDTSGSMDLLNYADLLNNILIRVGEAIKKPNVHVAIVSWDEDVDFVYCCPKRPGRICKEPKEVKFVDLNPQNFTEMKNLLNKLEFREDETTIYSKGLEPSIEIFKNKLYPKDTTKIIIFVTGKSEFHPDFEGRLEDLVYEAEREDIKIDTVGIGINNVDTPLAYSNLTFMSTITGGNFTSINNTKDVDKLIETLSKEMKKIDETIQKKAIATDVVVTDVLYPYLEVEEKVVKGYLHPRRRVGNKTVTEAIPIRNPDNTTTLIWKVGDMPPDSEWETSFDVSLELELPVDVPRKDRDVIYGIDPTTPTSEVTYVWWEDGRRYSIDIPKGSIKITCGIPSPPKVTPTPTPLPILTPTPTPPGFETIFAIAALLAVAYLVWRRRRREV